MATMFMRAAGVLGGRTGLGWRSGRKRRSDDDDGDRWGKVSWLKRAWDDLKVSEMRKPHSYPSSCGSPISIRMSPRYRPNPSAPVRHSVSCSSSQSALRAAQAAATANAISARARCGIKQQTECNKLGHQQRRLGSARAPIPAQAASSVLADPDARSLATLGPASGRDVLRRWSVRRSSFRLPHGRPVLLLIPVRYSLD